MWGCEKSLRAYERTALVNLCRATGDWNGDDVVPKAIEPLAASAAVVGIRRWGVTVRVT
jgi:hypothetical protein